ncbi:MAG: macro domain-containing protein [Deltaproteobacteria bacterium]|nr:macro domain-containing protein [Deltaproteobacteria bacterium]
MPFKIIRNDITRVKADAIVNTANPEPIYGSGTDYAVYMAAGAEDLLAERKKIGAMQTGEVFVTPAFRLPAKYIIHAVGPGWIDGNHGELDDLASCYRKSLLMAKQMRLESIAFPLIATGVNGFPKDKALKTALETIAAFLEHNDLDITLVVFNREAFVLSAALTDDVRQFIDDNYIAEGYGTGSVPGASMSVMESALFPASRSADRSFARLGRIRNRLSKAESRPDFEDECLEEPVFKCELSHDSRTAAPEEPSNESLRDILDNIGESFRDRLLWLIEEKGLAEPDVYKKAFIDRKLFSKIRRNPGYSPKKQTAVALAFALRLNPDETADLLKSAGYALSSSSKFDLIVLYCMKNGIYDLFEINALLFQYEQPMLGC